METFNTREECRAAGVSCIAKALKEGHNILNLTVGGEGGFVVQDISKWREKLSIARKGGKPALGMKHSKENKRLFSEVPKKYWKDNRKYNLEDINGLSFKEAKDNLGISRTHYYRLKRLLSNDQ